jgi:hypothetical protein
VFSIAYVILPFAAAAPADTILSSLAPFQRGGRGDVPDSWLAFEDETDELRWAHSQWFTFTELGEGGIQIEGDDYAHWYIDTTKVRDEMRQRELQRWNVRFADTMDLDTFSACFGKRLDRDPVTGRYGRWLNPLGHWDWWDLGGRFDGHIIGDPKRGTGRSVAQLSSGENRGRSILTNVQYQLEEALGQPPASDVDVLTNRNVELVTTLLADARAGRENAYPGALVLPPGAVEDSSRWLDTWPEPGSAKAFAWLGLPPDANWQVVTEEVYARFEDHWAAGIAYHF